VDEISENVEALVDLKHMVQTQMREDKGLMVKMFREVGDPEFRFVINSGLYFGFLFGMIQLPIFIFFPQGWILPVGGLIIGAITNWLALNIIFRPVKPIPVGPDRKSTRLNSSHVSISYAVFCLKKKTNSVK